MGKGKAKSKGENDMNKENNVVDFQMEAVKRNAPEILAELRRRHEETGECGVYDITPDGKLGEKLCDLGK